MQIKKGENLIEHEKEIYSRPARTWFQSEKEKQKSSGRLQRCGVSCANPLTMLCVDASKQQHVAGLSDASGSAATRKSVKAAATSAEKVRVHAAARYALSSLTFTCAVQPKRDKFAGLSRRAKRRKLALEEDEADRVGTVATGAAIRAAKKAARPPKIGEPLPKQANGKGRDKDKRKKKLVKGFDSDLSARGKKSGAGAGAREGARAKRGDKIGGMGGKKGKSKGGGVKKGKR